MEVEDEKETRLEENKERMTKKKKATNTFLLLSLEESKHYTKETKHYL